MSLIIEEFALIVVFAAGKLELTFPAPLILLEKSLVVRSIGVPALSNARRQVVNDFPLILGAIGHHNATEAHCNLPRLVTLPLVTCELHAFIGLFFNKNVLANLSRNFGSL
jgi:hypothetical protein